MRKVTVSIVIIGRNEAANLQRLRASLQALLSALPCETIFVDSASTDDSALIAERLFDRTAVLEASPYLNASAGRYVGTGLASGDWLLFLDGDMELQQECIPAIKAHVQSAGPHVGAVGSYLHCYTNGSRRAWNPPLDRHGHVTHFGGAVLLSMAMLTVENWDPRLYSNEEIELHTRLREHGFHAVPLNAPFISHATETFTFTQKLKGNFVPQGSFLGKKFYGIGQVIHARLSSGRMTSLIRWFPEPFILWGAIVALPVVGWAWSWRLALLLLLLSIAFVAVRKSQRAVVAYLAFLPQGIGGFRRFNADWRPRVARVISRSQEPG